MNNTEIIEKLLRSKKYAKVCPDTVRSVFEDCAARYRKPAEIEHAAREALHGITGAFMTPRERERCLAALREWAQTRDPAALEAAMACHASTRERLPLSRANGLLDRLLADQPEGGRVLDLACGIDPICVAARGARVVGMDISGEAVDLINEAGETGALPCSAVCADLLCEPEMPEGAFDTVFLFKILPLLERRRKGSVLSLLSGLRAPRLAVSFPTRTLGGRDVGMEAHYEQFMLERLPADRVIADRFTIANELFFILKYPE